MLTAGGQLAAIVQGFAWMILVGSLIGFVFVPMAWIAAVIARRSAGGAIALLLVPVVYLGVTWVPDSVLNSHPLSSALALVAIFTVP
ncbi:MAG TPA: hypothetical protein VF484_10835, partial [Candidatus Limnocylindrales bacterium]